MSKMTSSTDHSDLTTKRNQLKAIAATTASTQQQHQKDPKTSKSISIRDKTKCNQMNSKRLTDFSIETIIRSEDKRRTSDELNAVRPVVARANSANSTCCASTKIDCKQAKESFSLDTIMGQQDLGTNTEGQMTYLAGDKNSSCSVVKKYRPKNYPCPACRMAFSNNGQLRNHVRIHTGERPFGCDHPNCDRTFTRNEELTRHKMIHSGVRPHTCTSCGKSFGRKDHLRKHERIHDKKKKLRDSNRRVPISRQSISPSPSITLRNIDNRACEMDMFVPAKPLGYPTPDRTRDNSPPIPLTMPIPMPMLTPLVHFNHPMQMAMPSDFMSNSIASIAAAVVASTTNTATLATPPITGQPPLLSLQPSFSNADHLQQITGDYWQNWFHFMDFYQRQHTPQ